ncbi:hypothetical protein EYV94_23150 [Puteibacter caeruleilacunae]|nr:hypothetical protein EYV94_23150 [Puteibacter caeruleilacunae]
MRFLLFCLIVLLWGCSSSSDVSEEVINEEIVEEEAQEGVLSFNWECKQDVIPTAQKVEWEEQLAIIHDYFVDTFAYAPRTTPVSIVYFTDADAFKAYQLNELGKSSANPSGFYSPKDKKLYMINKNNVSSNAKNIFLHEGTHSVFASEINGGAIILNEGLATIFQTLSKNSEKYFVDVAGNYKQSITKLDNEGGLYGLTEFFQLSNQAWQQDGSTTYAQSNSVVYFLMSEHLDLLKKIVIEFKKSANVRKSYIELLDVNYSGGFAQFEHDWLVWIKQEATSVQIR